MSGGAPIDLAPPALGAAGIVLGIVIVAVLVLIARRRFPQDPF